MAEKKRKKKKKKKKKKELEQSHKASPTGIANKDRVYFQGWDIGITHLNFGAISLYKKKKNKKERKEKKRKKKIVFR